MYGAWIQATSRSPPAARASAPARNETSPMPAASCSTSVSVPEGQPPPGSSASSAACPVATEGCCAWASSPPRHTPDGERDARQVQVQRLVVGVGRDELGLLAAHLEALDRDVVADARDHDLA